MRCSLGLLLLHLLTRVSPARSYGWIELPTLADAEKLVKLAPTFGERPLAWAFASSPRAHNPQALSSAPLSTQPTNPKTPTTAPLLPRTLKKVTTRRAPPSPSSSIRNGVMFRDLAPETTEAQLKLAVMAALNIEEGEILRCRVPKKDGSKKG